MFELKRVYDPPAASDGARYLVERLWPRGVRKADLPLDGWLRDVAPSPKLRRWFDHDPRKWAEFRRRYGAELQRKPEALAPLLAAARTGPVTLLYSARDMEHNAAVVLRKHLLCTAREAAPRSGHGMGEPRAPREVFRDALRRAALVAPGRDVLPWVFRLHDDDTLELRADRGWASPVADPAGREAIIGCGAALFHLSVALHAAGHEVGVELLPDSSDPDLHARVRLDASHVPSSADRALIAAIAPESADGGQHEDRGIAPHVLSLLLCAARVEGGWLGFVELPALRRELAELVVAAHRRQGDDPRHPRERAVRAHQHRGAAMDLLPGCTAGLPELLSYLGRARPSRVSRDPALATRARAWVERAATIAVLTTRGDTRRDWLVAGQALARVLLTARAAGISASYLNQPIEVGELRWRVAALLHDAADPGVPGRRGGMPADATPQIVLRLGHARRMPSGSDSPSAA